MVSSRSGWNAERPGVAAKYRKRIGGSAQRPRAVQMVLRTTGQSLPLEERHRFLNPDVGYGTKSARLEKDLAHRMKVPATHDFHGLLWRFSPWELVLQRTNR